MIVKLSNMKWHGCLVILSALTCLVELELDLMHIIGLVTSQCYWVLITG
jgi:hypothetical protein